MSAGEVQRAVEGVWRIESSKVIARVARVVGDVGLAQEFAHDALVAALQQWPATGIPENPGAWLMATAKRRAIDQLRRMKLARRMRRSLEESAAGHDQPASARLDAAIDNEAWRLVEAGDGGDELLRLIFMTCHPALSAEARVALTLRLLGGLSTDEIARAFLSTEPTIAQRIVRAKRTLSELRAEFDVPKAAELAARLSSVLEVIYLVFNEGYTATRGQDWTRPALCDEALRLARMLAVLLPDEAEVLGLLALLEFQASRLRARVGADGGPILLADQNRAQWDALLIRRGRAALERALQRAAAPGPFLLQAQIAACHAIAPTAEATDWRRIAALYEQLLERVPSPVIALNHAVAVAMAFGPAVGLEFVDALKDEPALARYHLLPTVRGDLLFKLGRYQEAAREFESAAAATQNSRERALMQKRLQECLDRNEFS